MEYNFEKKIIGFCDNKKIPSIPLYIIKDLKNINTNKLISAEQKTFLQSAFLLEKGLMNTI